MNSPQRKYFRNKHEPYSTNLSTTKPFNNMQLTPKNGFTGIQLKNGQGGMLSLPGNSNFRSMASTMMESSPNRTKLKGHTKFNSTFDNRQTRNSSHYQTAGTADNGI